MIDNLRVGDEVLTAGGIFATVVRIEEDEVTVELSPGAEARVSKRAIAAVVTDEPGAETDESASVAAVGKPVDQEPTLSWSARASPSIAPDPDGPDPRRRRRRGPRRRARIACAQEGAARARPPGRPRGRAQGGAAEGPEDHEPRDSTTPCRSCATASTSSGVAEPEIRKQGSDQIVIELPGVKDAKQACAADREDRPARALRPPGRPDRPVGRRPRGSSASRSRRRACSICSPASRRRRSRRDRRPTTTCSARRSSCSPAPPRRGAASSAPSTRRCRPAERCSPFRPTRS